MLLEKGRGFFHYYLEGTAVCVGLKPPWGSNLLEQLKDLACMTVIWASSTTSYMENLSIKLGQMLTSSSGMPITRSITWFSHPS